MYQLSIPDFGLFTSLPSCHFASSGLNETLLFHLDPTSTSLTTFSFDLQDRDFLASVEKNPRKRRLLTTKQFEQFTTKGVVSTMGEGARPIFTKYKYDSLGREMKEKAPGQAQAPEENQSFFSKYWLYIMLAMMILPNLLGGGAEEGQAAGAGAAKK